MRALFVVTPGIGHLFPTVPLAWALRAAGHEVLYVTTGPALAAEQAGLPVVDAAPGFDFRAAMLQRMKENPEVVELMKQEITDLRTIAPRFASMAAGLTDGVVAAAEQWRPDVIVQTVVQGAGLVAASKLGIPLVQHGFGFARTAGVNEVLFEHMTEALERHGVTALPEREAAIDVAPPSLVAAAEGWSMRYVPYNGGGVLPESLLRRPADRPRVAVTLGTVAPTMTGLGPIERLIAAASQVDAEFVVALGDADVSTLGSVPDNVHLAEWIPLNSLLHTSSALVHHGGSGSTLGALAAGVPQLVLPSGADRYINGAAVREAGAGLSHAEDELDAELLTRLIQEDKLRRRALEVQAEMAALPSPTEIAQRVVDFVA
ncbi:salmochelin biosynthesis C-glycosyltransferase IroB [Kutzneria viridogrisea]|uniref:UDP:flavonoid glycosyltransferase YjiC (YdhE family) n=1 Tax=Kutzneria viridogrisea TaxID=47990 RepID=A0ABR6BEW9_9PSEU|nr:UDP:flavonoid glycosyltransferase YjiC (YdhE family) [Kutzneria viridogrisea]